MIYRRGQILHGCFTNNSKLLLFVICSHDKELNQYATEASTLNRKGVVHDISLRKLAHTIYRNFFSSKVFIGKISIYLLFLHKR